jgi:Uma2 family endonuclease
MSVAALARPGQWTFDDLDQLPDDGLRYEVVDGNLVVTPPPTQLHQIVEQRLQRQLFAQCPPEWEVVVEFSLRMGTDGRVPDLAIVRSGIPVSLSNRNPYLPEHFGLVGEVVSSSTRKTDQFAKPGEYAEAGIPIYWLIHVDPQFRIQGFSLQDGAYKEVDGPLPTPWGSFVPDLEQLGLT